jgi:hypothetical protein
MGYNLTPKEMGLILSAGKCIEVAENIIENCTDKIKYARSTASKRSAKQAIELYQAIAYHLKRLQEYDRQKNDENE